MGGANYYGPVGTPLFITEDRDLFLPLDVANTSKAWKACETVGLDLWSGDEPLDRPRDTFLAERIVERRALVRAKGHADVTIDFTYVMAGFEFESVWKERRIFEVEGSAIPVARLLDIVASKAAAGRPKDRLFLATHEETLRELLARRVPKAGDTNEGDR